MTNKRVTLEWIKCLINNGDTSKFYKTKTWCELAQRKRQAEHNECERCRAVGKYSPCEAVHHKLYLKARPDLALDINNLECLCKDCHYKEHHKYESKKLKDEFTERW